jgi:hypothetical protein
MIVYSLCGELKEYCKSDLMVAFKIAGREKDGSVVSFWKILEEDFAPRLKN